MKLQTLFVWMGLFVAFSVSAQDLNEVIVTGSRVSNYDGMPAVTVKKPADFLVQEIRLTNDSRSAELRKQEIISTVDAMLKRAASGKRIVLSYGENFLSPVKLDDEFLQTLQNGARADTSSIRLFVKTTLTANDNIRERIAEMREFIKNAQLAGRTYIEATGSDISLSIVNPEKYRYEILAKIAEENTRIINAMGSKCRVELGGLEGRVQWERTGVAELTLYIPYGAKVTDCAYEP